MPIYFTGQTGPALPVNSVQYNSGPGQFAGDSNLAWVPATGLTNLKLGAIGSEAAINGGSLWPGPTRTILDIEKTYTVDDTPDGQYNGFISVLEVDFPANTSNFVGGLQATAQTKSGNIRNYDFLAGYEGIALHKGTGVVNEAYGGIGFVANVSTGTINRGFAFYVYPPINPLGTLTLFSGLYEPDLAGVATNPYYSWFDSRGVLRVKEDNTFNSVGQAITALYNPQFTKYTAGTANYERIILGQWSSNVGQIGIEAGGTGTLRAMDFIGASVGFPLSAVNGQNFAIKILTELTTIAAAATTDTAIQIPANAVVFGVDVRVTVAIPTAATFTVIGAGSATVFNTVAVTVAANSTDKGTKSCPFYNATAQAIRITPDIQPGANSGRVRVTIHYYEIVAATS